MKKILEMRRKAAKLVADARKLLDSSEKLTEEQTATYDTMIADVMELKGSIDREERTLTLEKEMEESREEAERPEVGGEGEDENRAYGAGSKAYRKDFANFLRTGSMSPELRDLQINLDDKGGFLIAPETMANELLKNVDDQVVISSLATIDTLTAGGSLGIPTIENDPNDADWTTEIADAIEDKAMTFGKRVLKPHPLSKLILASNTLLRNSQAGAEAVVRERMGFKFGVTTEKAYMTGDGAGKPLGLFTQSTDGISAARNVSTGNTATAIVADNLFEVKYGLKAQYWPRANWLFSREAVKQIAKLKDLDGQYLWQQSIQLGQPDRLLGFPVIMSEFVPNTFTADQFVGMFADFSAYRIVRSLQLEIQRLVELFAKSNETGFIGRWEGDAMPVLEEAFIRIQLGS